MLTGGMMRETAGYLQESSPFPMSGRFWSMNRRLFSWAAVGPIQGQRGYAPRMARKIEEPTIIQSAGNKPKRIEEFVGHVNTRTAGASVARMTSPPGWVEPGQTPQFDEYTLVLRGTLRVETREGTLDVHAGQAVIAPRGEWVRYSTPEEGGAQYVAVCTPAFSPDTVHRDPE
jgi:mannose-6-phosphate isomerase-like protein (cupin superfamily)